MMSFHQPLAVIGIGVCFPFATGFSEFKNRLISADMPPSAGMIWDGICSRFNGYQFSALTFDYKKFGIPPIFRKAVSTETLLALTAVDNALEGIDIASWDLKQIDCFCGTSFGNDAIYLNALKIAAVKAKARTFVSGEQRTQQIDQFKTRLSQRFSATSHDRIGEMASSIPARIAHFIGSRGKCMSLDGLDLTGLRLLQTADDNFRAGDSQIAILTTFQRFNGGLLTSLLEEKGVDSQTVKLCEGAVTLVVCSHEYARKLGHQVHAICYSTNREPSTEELPAQNVPSFGAGPLGYGLANQVFQQIALTVATHEIDPCNTGMQTNARDMVVKHANRLEGQTLSGEYWQIGIDAGMSSVEVALDERQAERQQSPVQRQFQQQSLQPQSFQSQYARGNNTQEPSASEPIAICGYQTMAAQCDDQAAFWQTIVNGEDQIVSVDERHLSFAAFLRSGNIEKLSTYTNMGASIPDLERLELRLPVPLTPNQRARMDPCQKFALICAADALADTSATGKVAVVVGSNLSLSTERHLSTVKQWHAVRQLDPDLVPPDMPSINRFSFDGCSASGTARIISESFGLDAECAAIEAACGSSLAALNYAVKALQSGRVDTVICGGVEFAANERDFVYCSAQMMLSHHKIAPFSAAADGFSPGDGGAFFVLKRLGNAKKNGDPVHGVIHAISGSCDAKSMTAPDQSGQELAIRKTLAQSCISPDMVQYIEAHGTGTVLGDKTEIHAIAACYARRAGDKKQTASFNRTQCDDSGSPETGSGMVGEGIAEPLTIGSVKYNFGHCFAGAGALGLGKLLLSFHHRTFAPTPPRGDYNEALPLSVIPARVLRYSQPWPTGYNHSRYAALSAFGTGGINYHVILEQGDICHADHHS
jgi:acyl transferase domain-containing protein